MSIYGGKTWNESYFLFDKIYNNYEEMVNDIENIFIGRYVFIKYCNTTLSADIRKKLENNTLEREKTENEIQYLNNYTIDNNKGYLNSDRRIFRAIWGPDNKIIPQEIANLNIEVNSEDIENNILTKIQETQLQGPFDSLEVLKETYPTGTVGVFYLVKANDYYEEYFWFPTKKDYELLGVFGQAELNGLLRPEDLPKELGKNKSIQYNDIWDKGSIIITKGISSDGIGVAESSEVTINDLEYGAKLFDTGVLNYTGNSSAISIECNKYFSPLTINKNTEFILSQSKFIAGKLNFWNVIIKIPEKTEYNIGFYDYNHNYINYCNWTADIEPNFINNTNSTITIEILFYSENPSDYPLRGIWTQY